MRKTIEHPQERPRILARMLAEDLRDVYGGDCGCPNPDPKTLEETGKRGQDDWDLTNTGPDGD